MRKIVYYVATSIDGYISGANEDISKFISSGNGVEKYFSDLALYDTVIMGKNTYEFGYKYGLEPGQKAYPHMKHYIFSNNLTLENPHSEVEVRKIDIQEIEKLQKQAGSDIYLCGGGEFAGWLLDNRKINALKLKLNPVILGEGVKMFGNSTQSYKLKLEESEKFENDLQIMTYQIDYTMI